MLNIVLSLVGYVVMEIGLSVTKRCYDVTQFLGLLVVILGFGVVVYNLLLLIVMVY